MCALRGCWLDTRICWWFYGSLMAGSFQLALQASFRLRRHRLLRVLCCLVLQARSRHTNIKIYVQPGNPGLCGGVSEREARLGGRSHVMEGVFLALGFPFLHSWRDSWQVGLRGGAVLVRLTTSFRPCALYLASELCPLTTADWPCRSLLPPSTGT